MLVGQINGETISSKIFLRGRQCFSFKSCSDGPGVEYFVRSVK